MTLTPWNVITLRRASQPIRHLRNIYRLTYGGFTEAEHECFRVGNGVTYYLPDPHPR